MSGEEKESPGANCWNDTTAYDYGAIVDALVRYLRIRTLPVGMKRFRTEAEMLAVPRIRRPDRNEKLATDQVVAQARWLGWTLGITMENLMGDQCGVVVGLHPRSRDWLSGREMHGVWFGTLEDSAAHQAAMTCAPYGDYVALAVSPLASGRLDNPDICRRRRKRLRRLMGACAGHRGTVRIDPLLCRTEIRWRAGRRIADRAATGLSAGTHRGFDSTRSQRAALSDRESRYSEIAARQHPEELRKLMNLGPASPD